MLSDVADAELVVLLMVMMTRIYFSSSFEVSK